MAGSTATLQLRTGPALRRLLSTALEHVHTEYAPLEGKNPPKRTDPSGNGSALSDCQTRA
eukprot:161226-Pleurochrysis_carterae.AAC.1